MDDILRTLRSQEPAPGSPHIQYPGYPDAKYVEKRRETGIPLPRLTGYYFREMANRLNVDFTIDT